MTVCRASAAPALFKEYEDQVYSGITKHYQVFEIVDKYLDHLNKRVEVKDLSDAFYTNAVQRLGDAKKFFGNVPLNNISRPEIEDWILYLQSKGYKNGSVNGYITIIRMFFNYCIDRDLFQGNNPAARQALDDDSIRQIELSESDILEILQMTKCRPTLHTCCMLALFSGMRRGEIFQLCWSDIDFNNNIIRLRAETTKTKTAREIPLAEELKSHLLEVKLKSRSVRVISDFSYLKKISRIWHDHRYKLSCCKVNGLDLRFHDLRHVFGQRLLTKGVDILEIQQWLGHSSVKMTQKRYVNVQRRSNFKQINVLNFSKDGQYLVNDESIAQ